ncbi:MAG: ABC transporter substrate-binding protein [Oligoflexus sp.]
MMLVLKRSVLKKLFLLISLGLTLGFMQACIKKKDSELKSEGGSGKKILQHRRTSAHRSLDPMRQFDQASNQVCSNIYDTLLTYHYLKRPYQLEPLLLEKMPEKQEDGVTYLFTLKKGVRFHDNEAFPEGKGREMVADDVIYSLKRFADANVNNLSYVLMEGYIAGLDEFRHKTSELGKETDYEKLDVAGLKKVNDYQFTITFTRDNPLALYPLAFGGTSIVPREAVEKFGEDFANNPVGTGPFYMKDYSRRGNMILAKNPHYHQTYPTEGAEGDKENGLLAAAGKQLPLVDEVHLPLIEEPQPAMLRFRRGDSNWIEMNKDDFNNMAYKDENGQFKLKPEVEGKFQLYSEPSLSSSYMKFNMRDSLLGKNKALRQAIAYALNSAEFVELLYNGRGTALTTIVPLTIQGNQNQIGDFWYQANVEKAKEKLKEAGFPGGKGLPEIVIEYRHTNTDTRQQFEFVRNQLAQVGIKVSGNFQTFSNFLQKTESGNYQIADAGWAADYPDAENFYQLLFSENKAPGPNDGNFDHPRYDELYQKIRYMENGPERFELFKEMNQIIQDEVPVLLRFNPVEMGLLSNDVRNFKLNIMDQFGYKYLNLEKK